MHKGTYRIADTVVEICSIYTEVHDMCADYAVECADIEVSITTTQEDIEWEDKKSDSSRAYEGLPPYKFSASYLETLAVYRKLVDALSAKDILLVHGSAIAVDSEAYLFTAKSGTGKSTHTQLWMRAFAQRAVMINDDKPLLRISDEEVTIYGTPWDGKHHRSSNVKYPLKAICIVNRGLANHIAKTDAESAFPLLWQQTYRSANPLIIPKTLTLVQKLSSKVALYNLHCNMHPDAATVAYNGMNGE